MIRNYARLRIEIDCLASPSDLVIQEFSSISPQALISSRLDDGFGLEMIQDLITGMHLLVSSKSLIDVVQKLLTLHASLKPETFCTVRQSHQKFIQVLWSITEKHPSANSLPNLTQRDQRSFQITSNTKARLRSQQNSNFLGRDVYLKQQKI
jgi:hypothetical protein